MKSIVTEIKDSEAYVLVIGDLHIGDKAFGKESKRILKENIKFVQEHDNCRVILNGDLLNTATRSSKTSPFEQDMTLEDQITTVCEYLMPIKDKIIGAVCGNHEHRMTDVVGYDPTLAILWKLGVDSEKVYCKYTGIAKIRVGKRARSDRNTLDGETYTLVFSHTTGGGKAVGSKLNRIANMQDSTVANADIYCGSHNHSLSTARVARNEYNPYNDTITTRCQTLVSCGGYLEWNDSYAEAMQLEPMQLGSPIIRLDGKIKKVDVKL